MIDKDPRRHEFRGLDEDMEDVGVFDDLDFQDFFRNLRRDYNIDLGHDSAILEIGSGKGKLLGRLQKEGYFAVGIEPRERPEHTTGELSIIHQQLEKLPSTHFSKYDLVIADSVIDPKIYTHSPQEMIETMFKLLKPGGVLLYGMKGESALPMLVEKLGIATLLEVREDGLNKAYIFQKKQA